MTRPDPNARSLADLLREIDDLRDTVARLRGALAPFAEFAPVYSRQAIAARVLSAAGGKELLVEDFKIAAAALRE